MIEAQALNRRRMLAIGGIAAAQAWLGWPMQLAAGAGLPEPPVMAARRPEPGLVEADLVAETREIAVDGRRVRLMTYNGLFPGPQLRVREGETVRLRFTNRMNEATNLHFHGLHLPPNGRADNIWLSIDPGESFDYEFTISPGDAGLHWYHPHAHGSIARQLFAGLAGPIVVEGEPDRLPEIAGAQEHVLVLRDLGMSGEHLEEHVPADWVLGLERDELLVNGAIRPTLTARRGTLRLRIVNAANGRYFRLKPEDHPLHVIAIDGRFLERPVTYDEFLLVPGQRVETLIQLQRTGVFALLTLPYDRRGRAGRPAQVLMTIAVPTAIAPLPLPTQITSLADYAHAAPAVTRRVVFATLLINGRAFQPGRVDVAARLGDLEVWDLVNVDLMDHPFHIHTWYFQVLARDGRPEPFRAWRDTINLGSGQVVRVALPLSDYAGRSVFHCHISEHNQQGMMATIEVSA